MSKKQDETDVPENLEAVDPLGEIRSCARDLWVDDGSPSEKDWSHYWKQAEELILGGKSSGVRSDRRGSHTPTPRQARPLNAALEEVFQSKDNVLHSILVGAFR